jgi:polygalacturonase
MNSACFRAASLVVFFSAAAGLRAQDTRMVTEPKIPPVCVKLGAILPDITPPPGSDPKIAFADDETHRDTERIQKALDQCGVGRAVELTAARSCQGDVCTKNYPTVAFISGPLQLRDGVTLLIDKGVTLYASRDPKDYEASHEDGSPILCGTSMPRPSKFPTFSMNQAARPKGGCRPFISADHVKNAAIMGEGTIDGRGYAKLIGKDYSWWEMARRAQPHDDLYFSGKLVTADYADGFTLYGIHLNNSMNYHVSVGHTNGFTAWGVHLQTPTNKKLIGTTNDARNTDGIDPGTSTNVTVIHSWIDNGDDNIAIKQGVSHMSVIDNHFYSGHGMSIGSETVLGQSFLLVDGLTEDHTTSGIRIKSNVMRGGPVHDLVYKNICMRDVPIPIAISPYYTNQTVEPFENPNYKGDKVPDYKRITLENIWSETPGDVLIAGLDQAHRTEVRLSNVVIDGIKPTQVHMAFDELWDFGRYGENFPLTGKEVIAHHADRFSNGPLQPFAKDACVGKFVPYR